MDKVTAGAKPDGVGFGVDTASTVGGASPNESLAGFNDGVGRDTAPGQNK